MNDIKQQQTFDHAPTNNILNFAGGALDLWRQHNRNITTQTIAQFEQLFKQRTPTFTIDPTIINEINNNKRRNAPKASDVVDEKVRRLLRNFVVDKATNVVAPSIEPEIEKQLILNSIATLRKTCSSSFYYCCCDVKNVFFLHTTVDIQRIETAQQQPLLIAAKLNKTSKTHLPAHVRNVTTIGGHLYAVLAIIYTNHNDVDFIRRPDGPTLKFQNAIMPVRNRKLLFVT